MFGVTKLAADKIKGTRFVKNPKHVAPPSVLGTWVQPHEKHPCCFIVRSSMQLTRRLGSET